MMIGFWFPQDMTLGIQAKEFNFCSIRAEKFISHMRVLQVPFGKLQAGCHMKHMTARLGFATLLPFLSIFLFNSGNCWC